MQTIFAHLKRNKNKILESWYIHSFLDEILFMRHNEYLLKRLTKESFVYDRVYAPTVIVTDDERLERHRVFSWIRPWMLRSLLWLGSGRRKSSLLRPSTILGLVAILLNTILGRMNDPMNEINEMLNKQFLPFR